MKQNLKIWMVALVVIIGSLTGFAGKTVKKAMPKVEKEDMLISLPNRFYYFDEEELHCYNSKSGEDTLIVEDFLEETGSPKYRITDAWYDANSDCVYINLDQSGTQVQNKHVYQLTPTHLLKLMIELSGDISDFLVNVTDDYVYLNGFVDGFAEVNIPGVVKDRPLSAFYSLGLKPWKFSKHSLESLKKPNLDFYAITAPGVNVRSYGDSKAPRLGYFKTRPGWEEEGDYLMTEDADIDTRIHTRSFSPWHPEVGTVFASNKDEYTNEGWTNIIVDGFNYQPQVSSKFVKQVKSEPLVSMQQFPEGDLKSRIWKMNSVKYPGVWLMIGELPDCGEAPLYIGKEIDGMIVFKWRAGWPICSGEPGKRIMIDEHDTVFYGGDLVKNGYELDLSKINESDLEILFKVVEPNDFSTPVVVKIADFGVGTFWLR